MQKASVTGHAIEGKSRTIFTNIARGRYRELINKQISNLRLLHNSIQVVRAIICLKANSLRVIFFVYGETLFIIMIFNYIACKVPAFKVVTEKLITFCRCLFNKLVVN